MSPVSITTRTPASLSARSAGRVEAFYRPPTPDPERPQQPCEKCRGIGYFGKTGIFEMLIVNDSVREALETTPKLEAIRQAARNVRKFLAMHGINTPSVAAGGEG